MYVEQHVLNDTGMQPIPLCQHVQDAPQWHIVSVCNIKHPANQCDLVCNGPHPLVQCRALGSITSSKILYIFMLLSIHKLHP